MSRPTRHRHRKTAHPFRAVFSLPSGPVPGSSTNTPALFRACASVNVRELGLPTSSSEFNCKTTFRPTGTSNSRKASIACRKNATPPFMS